MPSFRSAACSRDGSLVRKSKTTWTSSCKCQCTDRKDECSAVREEPLFLCAGPDASPAVGLGAKLRTRWSALLMTERCPSMRPGLPANPRLLQLLFGPITTPSSSLAACTGLDPPKDTCRSRRCHLHPSKQNSCCYSDPGPHTPTLFCILGLAWLRDLFPSLHNLATSLRDSLQ